MDDGAQARKWTDVWYHSDENGMPDLSRPMTHVEMVQFYWEVADDTPNILAELYVNFHQFDRVEFLIFKDRLSAAILVANSTRQAVEAVKVGLEQDKKDGSRRAQGWEGESDMALDESLYVIENAQEISIGATMLTAVAALESLLKDLASDGEQSRGGLRQLVMGFLARHGTSPDEKQKILGMVSKVSDRRNTFAHTLTGSYWATSEAKFKFDTATMHDTLFTVGEIAIALEALLDEA